MSKRIIAVFMVMVIAILLGGCAYQMYKRPDDGPDDVWVCEEPYAYFVWNEDESLYEGKIEYKGKSVKCWMRKSVTPSVFFAEYENKEIFDDAFEDEDLLFVGQADYAWTRFTCEIEMDNTNFFEGELPVMEFVQYNKEEYIREHGPLE